MQDEEYDKWTVNFILLSAKPQVAVISQNR